MKDRNEKKTRKLENKTRTRAMPHATWRRKSPQYDGKRVGTWVDRGERKRIGEYSNEVERVLMELYETAESGLVTGKARGSRFGCQVDEASKGWHWNEGISINYFRWFYPPKQKSD